AQNLDRSAQHFPEKPAIVFEGRTLTYRALRAAVDRAAHGLVAMGVEAGDRVALFLPNIPEFAITYLAAQKVGAIAVAINAMLTTEELRYVLADSGARVLFTTATLLPQVQPLMGGDLSAERIVLCEGVAASFGALDAPAAAVDAPFAARDMDRDDAAAILYTSGTTGRQKGAVLSHGNVVSNMYATEHAIGVGPTDRLLLFLPLFHCFGQNFIMNTAFNAGATVVLHRRFVAQDILASIERDGVTMFFAVPAVYIALLNAGIEPRQLEGIRYYFSAAATMPIEVATRWEETFERPVHEGYGLTETSPFASYNHAWAHRTGSVGTPLEMVEIRVVDTDDREVPIGVWGEIVIKGPNVMRGYWNRPVETAAALKGGWFHTGDIGYRDADDYLFLVDRVKDMINVGGFKVWPREVEEALYRHPAIAECAVVGIPDALKGEIVKLVAVLRPGAMMTADDVTRYCREHMASYKVPQRVEFVAALPKSATGKILKRVLREQATPAEVMA
ncbi:MAG TPA: long-chain fatty acid--CoA ligase, partial [Thermomicrobiales bacterium]